MKYPLQGDGRVWNEPYWILAANSLIPWIHVLSDQQSMDFTRASKIGQILPNSTSMEPCRNMIHGTVGAPLSSTTQTIAASQEHVSQTPLAKSSHTPLFKKLQKGLIDSRKNFGDLQVLMRSGISVAVLMASIGAHLEGIVSYQTSAKGIARRCLDTVYCQIGSRLPPSILEQVKSFLGHRSKFMQVDAEICDSILNTLKCLHARATDRPGAVNVLAAARSSLADFRCQQMGLISKKMSKVLRAVNADMGRSSQRNAPLFNFPKKWSGYMGRFLAPLLLERGKVRKRTIKLLSRLTKIRQANRSWLKLTSSLVVLTKATLETLGKVETMDKEFYERANISIEDAIKLRNGVLVAVHRKCGSSEEKVLRAMLGSSFDVMRVASVT